MAETTVSAYSRSIYIASTPTNRMSVWALRDFVRALDDAGVPDDEKVEDHHNYDTKHLSSLSVRWVQTLPDDTVMASQDDAGGA